MNERGKRQPGTNGSRPSARGQSGGLLDDDEPVEGGTQVASNPFQRHVNEAAASAGRQRGRGLPAPPVEPLLDNPMPEFDQLREPDDQPTGAWRVPFQGQAAGGREAQGAGARRNPSRQQMAPLPDDGPAEDDSTNPRFEAAPRAGLQAQETSDYGAREEATHIGAVPEPRARSSARQPAARAAERLAPPIDEEPEEAQAAPSRQAGAYSRRNSGEGNAKASAAQPAEPELKPIDPAVQRRLVIAGGVIASVLAALITGSVLLSSTRPSLEELRILYPYGYANTPLPGGVVRPGAYGVDFELLGPTPCSKNGANDCLLFQFSGGNYSGTMAVRPGKNGWERVDSAPEASPPDRM